MRKLHIKETHGMKSTITKLYNYENDGNDENK